MKLFFIWQEENNGYDTYDSAVVCAKDEEDAKTIHPENGDNILNNKFGCWVDDTSCVAVKYIGTAVKGTERGVICASFNAG
jgi:hypothetical protein